MVRPALVFALFCTACAPKAVYSEGGLRLCPSAAGENCFLVTAAEAGLGGHGAQVDQFAVRPNDGARGRLLIFLNGSGGSPAAGASGGLESWYGVARGEGLHVLGVSYRSELAVGAMCRGDDACFEPTRLSQVTGRAQPGAASQVSTILEVEGIEARVKATLEYLATRDPEGGWADFLAADGVRWETTFVSGHSQGGGHAALLGKRHAVERVLMLASPCDALTDGSPATWLTRTAEWRTDASRFFGLWSPGDETCPAAPAIWERMGLVPSSRDTSGPSCAGQAAHSAPLTCTSENAERWKRLLQP